MDKTSKNKTVSEVEVYRTYKRFLAQVKEDEMQYNGCRLPEWRARAEAYRMTNDVYEGVFTHKEVYRIICDYSGTEE